jgi:DNA-binding transcriptional LysR family regulator
VRPDIQLTLSVGNRAQVIERLLAHDADLAFGGRPPETDRVTARAVRLNRVVLICAADDPLAGASVAPRALSGRSWLLREPGSGTRTLNEEYLATQALEAAPVTVGSNGAIKAAVRAGLGVSLVSHDAVATELEAGLLGVIDVHPAPAPRDWHVMRSRVGPVRPVVTEFLDFVRTHGN